MKYRLYTITNDSKVSNVAIPEARVEEFDAMILTQPEGKAIEDILNAFDAVLVN